MEEVMFKLKTKIKQEKASYRDKGRVSQMEGTVYNQR